MTKRQKAFSALGRFIKNIFTKNIPLKITALVFAILLWGYVLSIENPEYVKRIREVDIAIVGEDTLNNRGLMLMTRDTGTTDVDVLCKISKHSELDASRVTCYIDLSTITNTFDSEEDSKEVSVEVQTSVASEYGTVQGQSVGSVNVTVARLSSRSNIQVTVKTDGALADGFEYQLPSDLTVSLRGQKSEVDRISYAEATVDLSSFAVNDPATLAGTYDLVLPVQFYDSANVRLDDIVSSSGETVTTNVRVVIRAYKDVPIEPSIVADDTFYADYGVSCTSAQSTIRLYGDIATLSAIDSVKTEQILPGSEPGEERMLVNLVIPSGVTLDKSQTRVVTVFLRVWELMAEDVEYEVPITYSESKRTVALNGNEPKTVTVRVTGSVIAMKSFDPSLLTASVDLGNYFEGTFELPVRLTFGGDRNLYTIVLTMETVTVELIPIVGEDNG